MTLAGVAFSPRLKAWQKGRRGEVGDLHDIDIATALEPLIDAAFSRIGQNRHYRDSHGERRDEREYRPVSLSPRQANVELPPRLSSPYVRWYNRASSTRLGAQRCAESVYVATGHRRSAKSAQPVCLPKCSLMGSTSNGLRSRPTLMPVIAKSTFGSVMVCGRTRQAPPQ